VRTKRHVQPVTYCAEEETWVFEQDSDEEGTQVIDEEVEEGALEFESLDVRCWDVCMVNVRGDCDEEHFLGRETNTRKSSQRSYTIMGLLLLMWCLSGSREGMLELGRTRDMVLVKVPAV
jgi:hypothetical protein